MSKKSVEPKTLYLLELNDINITDVENAVLADPLYGTEGIAIESVFRRHRENTDTQIIMMKICLLDFTNGTNINKHRKKISLYELAEKIKGISNVDNRIKEGDPEVVNEIAKCVDAEGEDLVNLFSFASKYCHYHNRYGYGKDDYSIFDSVVQAVLPKYFKDVTSTTIENWRKEYQYESFNDFIGRKMKECGLAGSRAAFDHFLWYPNKDKMPIRKKDTVRWAKDLNALS